MARKPGGRAEAPKRPKRWDKMVSAAYLRMLGQTQAQVARAVGRSERTIRLWEEDALWAEAQAEARERWFGDAVEVALATVLKSARRGNVETAKWILERLEPKLAPPAVRHRHSGGLGVFQVLAQLSPQEILRLDGLSDEDFNEEMERLMGQNQPRLLPPGGG